MRGHPLLKYLLNMRQYNSKNHADFKSFYCMLFVRIGEKQPGEKTSSHKSKLRVFSSAPFIKTTIFLKVSNRCRYNPD